LTLTEVPRVVFSVVVHGKNRCRHDHA